MKVRVIKPAMSLSSEINVTPLVDVVLVLLIIFMVLTPLLEKDLTVAVPQTEKVDAPQVTETQLVVAVAADGTFTLNQQPVAVEQYVATLKAALEGRTTKLVFVTADGRANYGRVVAALDGAKAAGASTLGMMTDELGD
ncbi:MAG: biopolymer transporter ExbD [Myxococcaceae bacterium]